VTNTVSFSVTTIDDLWSEFSETVAVTAVNQALPNSVANIGALVINDNEPSNGVQKIITTQAASCALSNAGNVKCWGRPNTTGRLGEGTNVTIGDTPSEMGDGLPIVNLGTGRTATKVVSVGENATCALLDNSTVKCWGANNVCQLGIGAANTVIIGDNTSEMGDGLPAVNLGTGRTVTDISAGSGHVCAILDNGSLKCWGRNTNGQLGLGDTTTRGCTAATMGDSLPAVNFGGGTIAELSLGGQYTCVRLSTGSVKCWGENGNGQLGLGDMTDRGTSSAQMGASLPIVNLGSGITAQSLATGYRHMCAKLSNSSTKCWGLNSSGQLGLGDTTNRGTSSLNTPDLISAVSLGTGRTASSLYAGLNFTCAILDNNQTKCWGVAGGLGIGLTNSADPIGNAPADMGDSLAATNLGTGLYATKLFLSDMHICAVLNNGQGKCWGTVYYGELGLGHRNSIGDGAGEMGDLLPAINLGTGRTPLSFSYSGGANRAGAFSGSIGRYSHTCALLDNNTVKCWGVGQDGQLGRGFNVGDDASELANAPNVNLGTGLFAKDLAGTNFATCAVITDGRLKCWGGVTHNGQNTQAAYGDGTNNMGDSLPYVDLGTGRTVRSISAGTAHICAVLDNWDVKCFGGGNNQGQLGYGDTSGRGGSTTTMGNNLLALDFGANRKAVKVVSGFEYNCAILDNAKVKCWGQNADGQLGIGSTSLIGNEAGEMGDNLAYTDFGSAHSLADITASNNSACVLTTAGAARCWGANNWMGQLMIGNSIANIGESPGEMGNTLMSSLLGTGRTAKMIFGAGHLVNCFFLDNDLLKCVGVNNAGQLGTETTTGAGDSGTLDSFAAVNLGAGRKPIFVSGSSNFGASHESQVCAVLDNNSAKCWGLNANGQLGVGDMVNRGRVVGDMTGLPFLDFGVGF
jgi:alpha-tubulin suppressor-like RCC1 family protein